MIARRGLTLEEFWPAIGISRATLFNWLKRDQPPPSIEHQNKLVAYFGMNRDYVLFGRSSNLDPSIEGPSEWLEEEAAPYNDAKQLRAELQRYFQDVLATAGDHPTRLAWLLEQMRSTIRPPVHWYESKQGMSPLHREVMEEVLKEEKAQLIAERQAAQSGSSTGKTHGEAGR